jgi:hypothetical protein
VTAIWNRIQRYDVAVNPPDALFVATDETFKQLTSRRWWGGRVVAAEDLPQRLTPPEARRSYTFDVGHPTDGTLYVHNPCLPGHFLLPALANERMAQERLAAFTRIAAGLGARTVELTACEVDQREVTRGATIAWLGTQLGAEVTHTGATQAARRSVSEFARPPAAPFHADDFTPWLQQDPTLRALVDMVRDHHPLRHELSLEIGDTSVLALQLGATLGSKGVNVGGKVRSIGQSRWTFAITFWAPDDLPAAEPARAPQPVSPAHHRVLQDRPTRSASRRGIPFDLLAVRLEAWNADVSYDASAGFIKVEGAGGKLYIKKEDPVGRVDVSNFAPPVHPAIRPISREAAAAQHLGRVRAQLDMEQDTDLVLEAFDLLLGIVVREPTVEEAFFTKVALKTSADLSDRLATAIRELQEELAMEIDLGREYLLLQTRALDGKKPRTVISFSHMGKVQGQGDLPQSMVKKGLDPQAAVTFLRRLESSGAGFTFNWAAASGIFGYPAPSLDAVLDAWPAIAEAIRQLMADVRKDSSR